VQAAFREHHGLQCGFCTPGFVISVTAFLRDHPDPTDEQIREALSGNLCRCTATRNPGRVRAAAASNPPNETRVTMPGRIEARSLSSPARGAPGRSHAVRLAQEGADIIAIDICHDVQGALPMATPEDLAETVKLVEAQDRRIVATQADVRDYDGLKAAVDDGVAQLGRLDIVLANAASQPRRPGQDMDPRNWQNTIDINLSGLWNTTRAAIPHLIAAGRAGLSCSPVPSAACTPCRT